MGTRDYPHTCAARELGGVAVTLELRVHCQEGFQDGLGNITFSILLTRTMVRLNRVW